jgi:hypothetical protein
VVNGPPLRRAAVEETGHVLALKVLDALGGDDAFDSSGLEALQSRLGLKGATTK